MSIAARTGLLLALLTAACIEDVPAAPTAGTDGCGAASLRALIGQDLGRALADLDLAPDSRIIGPDTGVTRDHRPGRLNIHHDNSRRITDVRCG